MRTRPAQPCDEVSSGCSRQDAPDTLAAAASSDTTRTAGKPEPEPEAAEPVKEDDSHASRAPLLRLLAERLLDPELELPAAAGAIHKQVSSTSCAGLTSALPSRPTQTAPYEPAWRTAASQGPSL